MKGLGSDNQAPVHPRILEAITRANFEHAPSYGTDETSAHAIEVLRGHFGPEAQCYFVFNGTAANVLALGQLVRSHQSVVTTHWAHIMNDECGAPVRLLGATLIAVPTTDGKLTPELVRPHLIRRGDQHASQVRAISITQPTEVGTVYTINEIRALAEFAHREGLLLHVDGARLVNAAVSLGCTLKEMITDTGVDAVSLGGTKNGLLFGEAVIFLKPGLDQDFKYVRKQLMQLPSKTRFLAAQFSAWLGTDLWLENARHANAMAERLARGLADVPGLEITQKRQANGVFVRIPKSIVAKLKETMFFYVWDEHTFECRLMTSWDTKPEEIDTFVARAKELVGTQSSP